MSKILKNNSGGTITVSDTGITINNATQYTIPAQDYLLWAGSDDVIGYIGSGDLVVNDGSSDLSISDGTKLIQGIFPNPVGMASGDDKTPIGHVGDSLKASITNTSPIPVDASIPTTAFGFLSTASLNPYLRLIASEGLTSRNAETYTSGTGSYAGIHDSAPGYEFKVSSGTSVGGYGVIRTNKVLSYRPGIGSLAMFTARFSSPISNSSQRVGLFNIGNALMFGYNGTSFGILHSWGGRPAMRKLTVTNAANGNQTLTITLNGTSFNVNVTNGSAAHNAYEIAQGTYTGWKAYNIDNSVIFENLSVGPKTNTYTVSSTGGFTGSFSTLQTGITQSDTWIPQTSWNKDKLLADDGTFTLDPLKGNVFKIQYQYLGYGQIRFYIENPTNGDFILVHTIDYANTNTRPSLDLPAFKLGLVSYSLGSTSNLDVYSACLSGFHENSSGYPGTSHSQLTSVSGIGTSLTNVLALKKGTFSNGKLDITDIKLNTVTCASEATKPVLFEIRLNPTFSGETLWQISSEDGDTPIVYTSTGNLVTGGELIYSIALSKSSNISIDLNELDIILSNQDVIAIAARSSNGTTDAAVSAIWSEE